MHSVFIRILMLTCVLTLTCSVQAQTIVRPIVPPEEFEGGPVLLQFRSMGHLDARARGLGVFTATGEPVDYRLLGHDPESLTSLAVNLPADGTSVEVHYGPEPIADTSSVDADVPLSLVMRTFPLNRGSFRNMNDLERTIADADPYGTSMVDRIYFAHNPFGPDERFITDIEGLVRLDERTTLHLFSNHDAAAFLSIDDELVFASPQPYLEREFQTLKQAAIEVTLAPGTHRLRYLHVALDHPPRLALGVVEQRRAIPLPSSYFVHHPRATLDRARTRTDEPGTSIVGFDAEQLDRLAHEDYSFIRYAMRPITPPPDGMRYRWDFGDGTTAERTGAERFTHIFATPAPAASADARHERERKEQWSVTLELVAEDGESVAQATSRLRPALFGRSATIQNTDLLHRYAEAIGQAGYDHATAERLGAYYTLLIETEQPHLIAPIAEPFVERFGDRRSAVVRQMKRTLATHLSADDPKRAVELFSEVARTEPDSWQAVTAAAEQLDLMIFRLGQTEVDALRRIVARLYRNRTPRERALLEARLGDAHRVAGRFDAARQAYEKAQQTRDPNIESRRAAVQKRAYRETALSYLQQKRYPALRDTLLQWEGDFPTAKMEDDLLLLTGRYFQAVADPHRAVVEYRTLLEMNPMHPRRPEIAYRLGECLWLMGQIEQAREWLEEVAQEYPNSPFAQQAKARLR